MTYKINFDNTEEGKKAFESFKKLFKDRILPDCHKNQGRLWYVKLQDRIDYYMSIELLIEVIIIKDKLGENILTESEDYTKIVGIKWFGGLRI